MKKVRIILTLLLLLGLHLATINESLGQQVGFDFPPGERKAVIPFERYNNLIVIPVTINNVITLNFILDTGVQYPILTEKIFAEFMNLDYRNRIIVQGPGQRDSITAMVAQNVSIKLPGGVRSGINQALLVLEKDYLELKNNLGAEVYGIIGYDIFSRFVVEINYDDNYIVLHEPKKYKPRKRYKRVPMRVVNTKPYLETTVQLDSVTTSTMQFMVDTGASHALLFDDPESHFVPNVNITSVIGRGIGGDINGYLGRVDKIQIDKFVFESPLVSFPVAGEYGNPIKRGSRNGTIGGEIITRFNVVFDYFTGTLYLKKGKNYGNRFEHDMSGMNIALAGPRLDYFKVNSVREQSPAYRAGVRKGDVIKTINGFSANDVKLTDVNSLLRYKEGKKINVRYIRDNEQFKTSFKLERHI